MNSCSVYLKQCLCHSSFSQSCSRANAGNCASFNLCFFSEIWTPVLALMLEIVLVITTVVHGLRLEIALMLIAILTVDYGLLSLSLGLNCACVNLRFYREKWTLIVALMFVILPV